MTRKKVEPIGGKPSDVEELKVESKYLRGSLAEQLKNRVTGGLTELDNRLLKFHGSYMQDDRDLRTEREKQKLEPAYQFMLRVVTPGGVATPQQWLVMDELAQKYGNNSLRVTTRQAFQLHGVLKWNLKKTIKSINDTLLSTLAACGDVSRNVMCSPNPNQSSIHQEVNFWAKELTKHLEPRTPAYHEIWLDGEKLENPYKPFSEPIDPVEPIYGHVYLPRKFKIGIAVPPYNDIDVFTQDLGLIAVVEDNKLVGFNVTVGGGMGMTHGDNNTYPQLGKIIGFVPANTQVLDVAEKIVTIQRDYGNRSVRKYARFKYTIDRHGLDWFVEELHERLGWKLAPAKDFSFIGNGERYGWVKNEDGSWNVTLFLVSGRINDTEEAKVMTGLREIANFIEGDFRLTPNQNVMIGNIPAKQKAAVTKVLKKYNMSIGEELSGIRKNALSCVALPTCGLAMAEAERYLPSLIDKLEPIFADAGLASDEINIRMTGCPNGCARPALGEISFIGKSPGKYNMYLGAGYIGDRLNKLYKENIGEEEIISSLETIVKHYAKERQKNEHFGDFVIRSGYVNATTDGTNFHVI